MSTRVCTGREFQKSVATVSRSDVQQAVGASPATALITDETTDSVLSQIAAMIRCVDEHGDVKVAYAGVTTLPRGDADTVLKVCRAAPLSLSAVHTRRHCPGRVRVSFRVFALKSCAHDTKSGWGGLGETGLVCGRTGHGVHMNR